LLLQIPLTGQEQIAACPQTTICSPQYLKPTLHHSIRKCTKAVDENVLLEFITISTAEKWGLLLTTGCETGVRRAADSQWRVQRLKNEASSIKCGLLHHTGARTSTSGWDRVYAPNRNLCIFGDHL